MMGMEGCVFAYVCEVGGGVPQEGDLLERLGFHIHFVIGSGECELQILHALQVRGL
jgi:hypothetical protein